MLKIVKILLFTLLSLVILTVAGLTLLVNLVNPNHYKAEINRFLSQNTGRPFEIQGDLKWSLFPHLGIDIGQITVGNAPGFGTNPFLKVKAVRADINLIPLIFERKIQIGEVSLESAQVSLETNAAGVSNWQTASSQTTKAPSSTQADTPPKSDPLELSIQGIQITNSQIQFKDAEHGKSVVFWIDHFKSHGIGFDRPFSVELQSRLKSTAPALDLPVTLKTQLQIAKTLKSAQILDLLLTTQGIQLTGKASLDDLQTTPKFKGQLHLSSPDLRQVATLLGTPLDKLQNPQALRQFDMQLGFEGNPDRLNLTPFSLQLDQSHLQGQASVAHFNAPIIQFSFQLDQLNLDDYALNPSSAKTPATVTSEPDSSPNTHSPQRLTLDGNLSIQRLTAKHLSATQTALTVHAKDGLWELSSLKSQLYQGMAQAQGRYDLRPALPTLSFQLSLDQVQAEPLLTDFRQKKSPLSGTASLKLALKTQGADLTSRLRALNGDFSFSFLDGKIQGIDLDYQINRAKAILAKTPEPIEPAIAETPFATLTGSGKILQGVVNNPDLRVTSKVFTGKGSGFIDLNTQTVDYLLKINVPNAGDVSRYDLPILLKGQPDQLKASLDTSHLAQQLVKQEGQKFIETQGKKLFDLFKKS